MSGHADGTYPFPFENGDHIIVGSVADLRAIMGASPSSQSLATLSSGGVVVFYPRYVTDGRITFDWKKSGTMLGDTTGKTLRAASVPATVQATAHTLHYGMFMLDSTADRVGIRYAPSAVIAPLRAAPTQAQLDAIRADLQVVNPNFSFQIESGPQAFAAVYSWGILALTALIALAASVIALSLARADGRRDEGVLISLDAAPQVQRAFGFWQAIVIAGLGSIVGVVLGLVPAATRADRDRHAAGHRDRKLAGDETSALEHPSGYWLTSLFDGLRDRVVTSPGRSCRR